MLQRCELCVPDYLDGLQSFSSFNCEPNNITLILSHHYAHSFICKWPHRCLSSLKHIYSWFLCVYTHIYSKSVCLHAQWLLLVPHIVSFITPVPSIYESERAPWKVSEVGSVGNLRSLLVPCPGQSPVPASHSHHPNIRPLRSQWRLLSKKAKYPKVPEFLYCRWKCIFLLTLIKGLDLNWSLVGRKGETCLNWARLWTDA